MRTIKGESIKFKDLNVGDMFGFSEYIYIFDHPSLNIKVASSVIVEYLPKGNDYAFNGISLEDGRARTFHDEQDVYLFNQKDIFV